MMTALINRLADHGKAITALRQQYAIKGVWLTAARAEILIDLKKIKQKKMILLQDLIKKDAMALKARTNTIQELKEAELKVAKLKTELSKPVNSHYAAIRASQGRERLGRFASAMGKNKWDEAQQALKAAGWLCGMQNEKEGTGQYGKKELPGYVLKIANGCFSVANGCDVKVNAAPLKNLKVYLETK